MMCARQRFWSSRGGLLLLLSLCCAIVTGARGEEAREPGDNTSRSVPFHLKSDVIPISDAAFLVFEEWDEISFFLAPHDPVEVSSDFSCHSLSEAIGVLEKHAVIQHGPEILKRKEKQTIGDAWRILKIRPGTVEMVNERSQLQESFAVPCM